MTRQEIEVLINQFNAEVNSRAWASAREDPAMQLAYASFCKRMVPSKAIIKIARKLVNRIYYVMKHQQEYVKGIVA